jgi:hypothetical protein
VSHDPELLLAWVGRLTPLTPCSATSGPSCAGLKGGNTGSSADGRTGVTGSVARADSDPWGAEDAGEARGGFGAIGCAHEGACVCGCGGGGSGGSPAAMRAARASNALCRDKAATASSVGEGT